MFVHSNYLLQIRKLHMVLFKLERDRETERQRDRETERQRTEGQRDRERDRETERQR